MRKRELYWPTFAIVGCVLMVLAVRGQEPSLVMTKEQVRTFAARAPRVQRHVAARHNQPTTDIVTPGPSSGTPEEMATADRWCKAMGYEWLCGRGDFVHRWYVRIAAGDGVDPAQHAADEGFDSPAVDCTYNYSFTRFGDLAKHSVWTVIRNGVGYTVVADAAHCPGDGSTCNVTITTPCVNEKWPGSIQPSRSKCVNAATGQLTDGPCR